MQVEMNHICKSFGANNVLTDISFSIKSGEVCALLGENGAGKSTLMNILGGVLEPDAGTIELAMRICSSLTLKTRVPFWMLSICSLR